MQVSDGCGIIFNPLFLKKRANMGQWYEESTISLNATHTHICLMKQLSELSSLVVKISLEI